MLKLSYAQITPLHHDPYINLFQLASTSGPAAAKHFLILPPSPEIASHLKRPDNQSFLRNTSPVDFVLNGDLERSTVDSVNLTQTSPSQSHINDIGTEAFSVTLKEGEMLLLPEKWWHRVQNIGSSNGWTAGIGYWFRKRSGQAL